MRKPKSFPPKFKRDTDVIELLEVLPRVGIGIDGYTEEARSGDFLAVFNGASTAEQGRRVLSQLSTHYNPLSRLENADKPGVLAYHEGLRGAFNYILRCMTVRVPPVIIKNSLGDLHG